MGAADANDRPCVGVLATYLFPGCKDGVIHLRDDLLWGKDSALLQNIKKRVEARDKNDKVRGKSQVARRAAPTSRIVAIS